MKLSSSQFDLGFLTTEFEQLKFEMFSSSSPFLISCIACWSEDASNITVNWRAMQSLISAHYQPTDPSARWNVYMIFFCKEKMPIRDKYLIHNDKYALRKIVIDGLLELPSGLEAEKLINQALVGADLELTTNFTMESHEEVEPKIEALVKGTPLDLSAASKAKRAATLNSLIELLSKNENQES